MHLLFKNEKLNYKLVSTRYYSTAHYYPCAVFDRVIRMDTHLGLQEYNAIQASASAYSQELIVRLTQFYPNACTYRLPRLPEITNTCSVLEGLQSAVKAFRFSHNPKLSIKEDEEAMYIFTLLK